MRLPTTTITVAKSYLTSPPPKLSSANPLSPLPPTSGELTRGAGSGAIPNLDSIGLLWYSFKNSSCSCFWWSCAKALKWERLLRKSHAELEQFFNARDGASFRGSVRLPPARQQACYTIAP